MYMLTVDSVVLTDSIIRTLLEAVRTSETSVSIYLNTRQYIPKDSELHVNIMFTNCLLNDLKMYSSH
jgi:hypothetical protein